jgi:hypothetical protein
LQQPPLPRKRYLCTWKEEDATEISENRTSTVTVVTTTTIITTVYSKKRDSARDFLQARQDLGGLPYALIQDLCDCLGVAHPATPTKTATTVKEVTETKSATVTTTTTVKTTTTSTATAYTTT